MDKSEKLIKSNLEKIMFELGWTTVRKGQRRPDYSLLAAKTNLTRSGIYKIIKGDRFPSSDNIDRIAKALGVSQKELLEENAAIEQKSGSFLEKRETYFSHHLRKIREARSISQVTLAALVGRDGPTVSRWESAYTEPSFSELEKIAEALSVPISAFFPGGEVKIIPPTPAEALEIFMRSLTPEIIGLLNALATVDDPERANLLAQISAFVTGWTRGNTHLKASHQPRSVRKAR